nr:alpha/beta hydrolase [Candidatus Woesebacteria bacterium]
MAIFGLLQALPENIKVKACYLVGSFKNDLNMDSLSDLFLEPFDYETIKTKSRLWYFIHSDNDPYCPLEHAEFLHSKIGGDLLVLPNQKHFSVSTYGEAYRQFPYLLQLIASESMTETTVVELLTAFEQM